MIKIFSFMVLLSLLRLAAFSQYALISASDQKIDFLSEMNDTSLKKIIDKIYVVATIKEMNNKVVKIDVTNKFNGVIKIPDSISNYHLENERLCIEFHGFLYDFFCGNTTENQDFKFDELGFDSKEIEIIEKIKKLRLRKRYREEICIEQRRIKTPDGKEKLLSFETTKLKLWNYFVSEYNKIKCTIFYSPILADIYIIPKKDWIYDYKLSDPPIATEVSAGILQKLSNLKISQGESPFTIELNEKAYVILYNRNGQISFDHLEPSTIYETKNTLKSKLN